MVRVENRMSRREEKKYSNDDRRGKSYVQEKKRHGMMSETSEDEAKGANRRKMSW